jgi:dipeptide/tripeptide permease
LRAGRSPPAIAPISIFYVGVSIGPFQAPLICGTLGGEAAWHYGFAAAGGRHASGADCRAEVTPGPGL